MFISSITQRMGAQLKSGIPFHVIESLLQLMPEYTDDLSRKKIDAWIGGIRRVRRACRWETPAVRATIALVIADLCIVKPCDQQTSGGTLVEAFLDPESYFAPTANFQVQAIAPNLDVLARASAAEINLAIEIARYSVDQVGVQRAPERRLTPRDFVAYFLFIAPARAR